VSQALSLCGEWPEAGRWPLTSMCHALLCMCLHDVLRNGGNFTFILCICKIHGVGVLCWM